MVLPSADDLLKQTVRKLLFMTNPARVDAELKPFWEVRQPDDLMPPPNSPC